MKNFLLGLSVGVAMCLCGFIVYVFVSQFDFQQNRSLDSLDQLYFAQPRDGCLTLEATTRCGTSRLCSTFERAQ